jgi:hypothetical protein
MSIQSLDFLMIVSASDLVQWPSKGAPESANPRFADVAKALGVKVDAVALCRMYFEQLQPTEGDVYLHVNSATGALLAVDLYKDPTDQLDLITVCCRMRSASVAVRHSFRAFFDSVEHQLMYEEGRWIKAVDERIDQAAYPRSVSGSSYSQKLVVVPQGN